VGDEDVIDGLDEQQLEVEAAGSAKATWSDLEHQK
jgi:hypothetical protein